MQAYSKVEIFNIKFEFRDFFCYNQQVTAIKIIMQT